MRNKPTAILTADIHLRSIFPRNRIDDYFAAQSNKIKFLFDLQKEYNIPILDAGDLFDKWNSTPFLEAWAITNLPTIITIPGNHELPSHNVNYLKKSSLYVLKTAKKIDIQNDQLSSDRIEYCRACLWQNQTPYTVLGFHYNYNLDDINNYISKINKQQNEKFVAIIHHMIIDEDLKYKDKAAIKVHSLFDKMKGFDLILSGHNHKPFVIEHDGRLLVNPGSMMRMKKDQINHKPRVYLWYAEENKVEPFFYPIEKNVFAIEQIEKENKKENQMKSYIKALNENYKLSLSYKKNMEIHIKNNSIRKPVQDYIWRSMND